MELALGRRVVTKFKGARKMALVYTLVKLLLMRLGKTKMYLTDVFMASGEEMSQNMIPMGVSCH